MYAYTNKRANAFAKELRKRQTDAEKLLWQKLRNRRFYGYKFRRQTPVGPFIVDFLCFKPRLILEVDGNSHWLPGAQAYDRRREAYLRRCGFHVVRCGNTAVYQNMDSVLERLLEELERAAASPQTPSCEEGGTPT